MSHTGTSSWTLTGTGFSVICLHRLSRVRSYIPSHFNIQPVFPGHTLGGFYGLHYDQSPIGPYDELIVFPALVTFGGKVGCYVSHSYINNERALQGGMRFWRWPRELRRLVTDFTDHEWKFDMYEAGEVIFAVSGRSMAPTFPFHFSVPFIDDNGGQVEWYSGLFDTQIQFTSARLKISANCPFSQLARGRRLLSVSFKSLHVVLGEPSAIQSKPIHRPAYATPAVSTSGISDLMSQSVEKKFL